MSTIPLQTETQLTGNSLAPLLNLPPLRPALYRLLARASDGVQGREQIIKGLQSRSRRERYAATRALLEHYERSERRQQVEIRVALASLSADPALVEHLLGMLQRGDEEERAALAAKAAHGNAPHEEDVGLLDAVAPQHGPRLLRGHGPEGRVHSQGDHLDPLRGDAEAMSSQSTKLTNQGMASAGRGAPRLRVRR